MTRRCLPWVAGALLLCGVAAGAPAPAVHLRAASLGAEVEGVRPEPAIRQVHPVSAPIDVHLGDGIFRLCIRAVDSSRVSVTIEVAFAELWRLIRSS